MPQYASDDEVVGPKSVTIKPGDSKYQSDEEILGLGPFATVKAGSSPTISPLIKPGTQISLTQPDLEALEKQKKEGFISPLARTLAGTIPLVGQAGGEAVAGPGGALAGGFTGSMLEQALQKMFPNVYGKEELGGEVGGNDLPMPVKAAISSGLNYGMGKASEGLTNLVLPTGRQNLSKAIIQRMFPSRLDPEMQQSAKDAVNIGLRPNIRQATGSPFAEFLEKLTGGTRQNELEQMQSGQIPIKLNELQQGITGNIPQGVSPTRFGNVVQRGLESNKANYDRAEDIGFQNFRENHAAPHTATYNVVTGYEPSKVVDASGKSTMVPQTQQTQIPGPIIMHSGQSFAKMIEPEMDAALSRDPMVNVPGSPANLYGPLMRQAVHEIAEGTHIVNDQGQVENVPVKSWDSLKKLRTLINSNYAGKIFPDIQQGGLSHLADLLGKDIKNTVSDWGPASVEALEKANRNTQVLHSTFNDEVLNSIYKDKDARQLQDPSQVFQETFKSPENARRLMNALPPDYQKFMKADYQQNNLFKGFYDPATQKFNPNDVLRTLMDSTDPGYETARAVLNAPERNGLQRFARATQIVSPGDTSNLLTYRRGMYAVQLLGGIGSTAMGVHTSSPMMGGTGLSITVAVPHFLGKLMTNPEAGAMAANAMKMKVDDPMSKVASKTILYMLRGSQVMINRPDGSQSPGMIDEKGKLKETPAESN